MKLEWPFKKHLYRADKALYLTRYTLLRLPFLRIRLHHIFLSDNECLHDHPWDFMSIILKGGYWEVTEYLTGVKDEGWPFTAEKALDKIWYNPGKILFRKANSKHRIELGSKRTGNESWKIVPCWTLLFMIPRKRDWGFWTKAGKFIKHNVYERTQNCE